MVQPIRPMSCWTRPWYDCCDDDVHGHSCHGTVSVTSLWRAVRLIVLHAMTSSLHWLPLLTTANTPAPLYAPSLSPFVFSLELSIKKVSSRRIAQQSPLYENCLVRDRQRRTRTVLSIPRPRPRQWSSTPTPRPLVDGWILTGTRMSQMDQGR